MADIALSNTSAKVNVGSLPKVQWTGVAGEAIATPGPVYFHATTGRFFRSDGNAAAPANGVFGIATHACAGAGEPLTVIRQGPMDQFDVSALNFGAKLFLSDTVGALADAAGTRSVVVGTVVPVFGTQPGTTPDKILLVEITDTGA
jgi:hypothetical protein